MYKQIIFSEREPIIRTMFIMWKWNLYVMFDDAVREIWRMVYTMDLKFELSLYLF